MMIRKARLALHAGGLIAAIIPICPLAAQAVSAGTPDTASSQSVDTQQIVVTGSKLGANLDKAPVAVSVLGPQQIARSNISTLKDVQLRVPSLTYNDQSLFAQAYIRGIGTAVVLSGLEPAVATYLDGVYLQRSSGAISDILDVRNVQILKGPQGTLYGRNATAGAIVVETNNPTQKREGMVSIEYGNLDTIRGQAVANVPISDTLAIRVAVSDYHRGGYGRDTVNGGKTYIVNAQNARIKLGWTPTPDLSIVYSFEYVNRKLDNPGQHQRLTAPLCLACGLYGVTPSTGFYDSTFLGQPHDTVTSNAHTLNATWKLGDVTITSVTSRRWQKLQNLQNNQAVADASLFFSDVVEKGPTFTEDFFARSSLRGPLNFLGGFSYERDRADLATILRGDAFAAVGSRIFNHNHVTLDSYSLYGDLYFNITPEIKITGGVRYNLDHKKIAIANDPAGALVFGSADFHDGKKFKEWTPHAIISYEALGGYYYASYSRGARSGGYSTPAFGPDSPLESEHLDNFEIGAKNHLLDNKVRTSIAAFLGKYSNIQVLRVDPFRGVVAENAAKAKLYGVEFDVDMTPVDGLQLSAGGAYVHNNFTSYPGAAIYELAPNGLSIVSGTINLSHTRMPRSPRFSAYGSANYKLALSGGWSVTPAALVRYSSSYDFFAGAGGPLRLDRQRALTLVNATVTLTTPSETTSLVLFGSNLTNKKYFDYASTNTFGAYYNPATPRTWGVRLTQTF